MSLAEVKIVITYTQNLCTHMASYKDDHIETKKTFLYMSQPQKCWILYLAFTRPNNTKHTYVMLVNKLIKTNNIPLCTIICE